MRRRLLEVLACPQCGGVLTCTATEALTPQQRYDWAILDTFDMLSPQYDQPRTQQEVEEALSAAGIINLQRLDNSVLNVIGEKGVNVQLGSGLVD